MPPKAAALLKGLREQFSPEFAFDMVDNLVTSTIPAIDGFALTAAQLHTRVSTATGDVFAEVIDILDKLQATQASTVLTAMRLRSIVAVRIPELKEEDNLGVSVQIQVIKQLDEVERQLVGDDKAVGATLSYKAEYLSARAAVEEKLNPSGKDAQPSKSVSLALQLRQLDADAVLFARIAFEKLASSLRGAAVAYLENQKKLINPRTVNDRMVS